MCPFDSQSFGRIYTIMNHVYVSDLWVTNQLIRTCLAFNYLTYTTLGCIKFCTIIGILFEHVYYIAYVVVTCTMLEQMYGQLFKEVSCLIMVLVVARGVLGGESQTRPGDGVKMVLARAGDQWWLGPKRPKASFLNSIRLPYIL